MPKNVMRHADAFAWNMERDPTLRSTIVVIAWFERSPDWDVLVERLDRATRQIPMFRQRVIESGGPLGAPRWTDDERFDLTWHLRRVDSPAPHTRETVVAIARNATMTAFDPAYPLWEFTLVEHLEDDKAAMVMKVHHALDRRPRRNAARARALRSRAAPVERARLLAGTRRRRRRAPPRPGTSFRSAGSRRPRFEPRAIPLPRRRDWSRRCARSDARSRP